jgi:two-component system NtrC family sensor kinase
LPAPPPAGGGAGLVWLFSLTLTLVFLGFIAGHLTRRLARTERELAGAHGRLARSMRRLARAHRQLQEAYGRLARAESRLVAAEKMRAFGVLVAGVAHELGNPLTVLAGNLDPLEEHFSAYDRLASRVVDAGTSDRHGDDVERELAVSVAELRRETPALLANCREATERAVALLAQLRAFGRGGAAARRLAPIRPGLESTLALVRHRLPPETVVHTSFTEVPDVWCVPAELNQVFMNLLLNAADALRPHGTLSVALDVDERAVHVRVADDGIGIDPAVLSRLFEPFFTTKETGAGSGLGLAISHAIVARHGGALEVEAPAQGGAVFTVRLPLADDRVGDGPAVPDADASARDRPEDARRDDP